MKKYWFLVVLLFAGVVQAQAVKLEFTDISINKLVPVLARDVLKKPYVMSPEVLKNENQVSLKIAPDQAGLLEAVRGVLAVGNVAVEERGGVLFFQLLKDASGRSTVAAVEGSVTGDQDRVRLVQPLAVVESVDVDYFVYLPKHRPVELLQLVVKLAGVHVPEIKGRADSIVFSAGATQGAKIMRLLQSVDLPLKSVMVKAALLEYQDSSDGKRGVSALLDIFKGRFGAQIGAGSSMLSNAVRLQLPALELVLGALEGDTRFRSISEPSMRVLDGETARLVVGADVPTRGDTSVSNGTTTTGVHYKTAGVLLEVEPRIQADSVVMKVRQTISDVQQTTTSGIDSPTLTKREMVTTVDLQDGEILLIGGIDQAKNNTTRTGLSFLPSAFDSTSDARSTSQILLLLEARQARGSSI